MILYFLPPSPPCRMILLLAQLIGLEFDRRIVNIMEGEQLKPEFLAMNPQHTIPTIDDNGLILWESRVIATYLVDTYAKDDSLYPRDSRIRAVVDQRLQFDLGTLYQRMGDYYLKSMFTGAPLDDEKKTKLVEAMGWLEALLTDRDWLADKKFTLADLSVTITVSQIEAFGFDMSTFPNVNAWLKRSKEYLGPYQYEEINGSGAKALSDFLRDKLKA